MPGTFSEDKRSNLPTGVTLPSWMQTHTGWQGKAERSLTTQIMPSNELGVLIAQCWLWGHHLHHAATVQAANWETIQCRGHQSAPPRNHEWVQCHLCAGNSSTQCTPCNGAQQQAALEQYSWHRQKILHTAQVLGKPICNTEQNLGKHKQQLAKAITSIFLITDDLEKYS